MLLGDVADQLLDDDRLADAGAAEDADLAALGERRDQVDDLDAGLEDLDVGRLLVERRAPRGGSGSAARRLDGTLAVDRLAEHVEHAAERRRPTGTVIGAPVSTRTDAAREAVGGGHRHVRTQLLPRCCCTSQVSGASVASSISTAL